MPSAQVVFEGLLSRATVELFRGYGLTATPLPPPHGQEPLATAAAAVIGFSGPEARGMVMFCVPEDALAQTKQAQVTERDWLAELTNQLLGRMKNRLAPYGVDVTMSTPLVIRGERLSPTLRSDDPPRRWAVPGGEALCWLDLEAAPGLELRWRAIVGAVSEGESVIF